MTRSHLVAFVVIVGGGIALASVLGSVKELAPVPVEAPAATVDVEQQATQKTVEPLYDYNRLRKNITAGRATLADARRAMTDTDPVSLSNSIHASYTMRRHRGVVNLLDGMWELKQEKYPELAWKLIAKPPARIAIANVINRARIVKTEPYVEYIRSFKDAEHEFIRAQVSIALGFNGELADLPYLKEMSDGDNHYVAQSAITALTLFGSNEARDVLIELADKHAGTPRGELMTQLLRKVYQWSPSDAQQASTVKGQS